jgi:hypothetical protein
MGRGPPHRRLPGEPACADRGFDALRERARAFDLYERGYAGREACMIMMASDPRYDLVRDDARFAALIRRAKAAMTDDATR